MSPSDLLKSVDVEWNGRKWVLRRATVKTERLFKAHLERLALATIAAHADMVGESGTLSAMQAVSRDGAARYYAWGRPGWARCLEDDNNFAYALWLMLTQDKDQRNLAFEEDDARGDQPKMLDFFRAKRTELTAAWNTLLMPDAPEVAADRPLERNASSPSSL